MKLIGLRVDENINNRLSNLAKQTGRPKTFYIKKSLEEFLEKHEDCLLGLAILEDRSQKEYSLTEAEKILDESSS